MEVSTETEGRFQVVTVEDSRIDAAVALDFKEAMRHATEEGPETVVLDLGKVGFIDSSGLGAVVATMKHLAPDRILILAGLTPPVSKVFQLTRMDSVFALYPDLNDALAALRG